MEFAQIFIFGMLVGGMSEYLFAFGHSQLFNKPLKVNHHFGLFKKLSLLSIPLWGVLALLVSKDHSSYINLFIIASLVGPFLEYLVGAFYHRIYGVRIWSYKYGAIGSYTSIYVIPLWGGTALLFVLIAKMVGI